MPTAVASFDDFDVGEPARKRAPRKPRGAAPKSKGAPRRKGKRPPRFALDMQRIVRWGAIGMSGSLALAIMVNALVLQKGHHPAPLFGKAIALGSSPAPAARAPQVAQTVEDAPPPAVTSAPPAHREVVEAAPTTDGDPIGQLIAGKAPPAAAPGKTDTRTVMGAQRALAKLGFALKPNGTLGPQTRKAIESFERDHHLPVNGELGHRLIRVLASASGAKID